MQASQSSGGNTPPNRAAEQSQIEQLDARDDAVLLPRDFGDPLFDAFHHGVESLHRSGNAMARWDDFISFRG